MSCTLNSNSACELPPPNELLFSSNLTRFYERFPQLCVSLSFTEPNGALRSAKAVCSDIMQLLATRAHSLQIETARSGDITVAIDGRYLYSKYNPRQEVERAVASVPESVDCCIFPGLGLGYAPEAWMRTHHDATVIVIEPDVAFLFLTLLYHDCETFFSHRSLCLLLESPLDILGTMLNAARSGAAASSSDIERDNALTASSVYLFLQPAIAALNKDYYNEAAAIVTRANEKNEINEATRKKFCDLWTDNMCRNISHLRTLPGIAPFKNLAQARGNTEQPLPVLLLAAGPSLDEIRTVLPDLASRCIVVCVDTALRFCLSVGVEPDFVILVDPQYWNYRHIGGLASPQSCLITESAAYPAVFRFTCRQTFLCAPLFPLGQYLDAQCKKSNIPLGAGGSVATTAWSFACELGADVIYVSGLDLSYPGKKTHVSGSLFEERSHSVSSRFAPAEGASAAALYGAGRIPAVNYRGEQIVTDRRMQLYAWWFESKVAALHEAAMHDTDCQSKSADYAHHNVVKTRMLGTGGMVIPGIEPAPLGEWQLLPNIVAEKQRRITAALLQAKKETTATQQTMFDNALKNMQTDLTKVIVSAERGEPPNQNNAAVNMIALTVPQIRTIKPLNTYQTDSTAANDARNVYDSIASVARHITTLLLQSL